uniref:CDC42 effector protein (Rho GTPase binding) 1b n=1 Tax=Cyprinus carpio TaxID=7962 RepID=A0A8C2EWY5_CYPCA
MSLGKLPAIKGLVSTSHGKRRFKSDLSVDMISPPLGDFRHTMHVGRGGDVFGDTSFLSNYGGSSNSEGIRYPDSPSGSKPTRFLSRTLGGSRDFSSPPPPISPIIKNAISLPQLNMNDGGLMRALLPTSTSSPDEPLCSYGTDTDTKLINYITYISILHDLLGSSLNVCNIFCLKTINSYVNNTLLSCQKPLCSHQPVLVYVSLNDNELLRTTPPFQDFH